MACVEVKSKYMTIILLVLILVLQIALRMPFLEEPLERDEGAYAYIAQRMLVGEVPYRDYYDHKPPAIYFIYAAVFKAFGESQAGLRYFTLFFSLIITLSVFGVGYLVWGRIGGLLSAFLYALFSGGPYVMGTSSNTEIFMILPVILALYCFLRAEDEGWFFWCGLLSGLAMMIKQVALLNFLVLFAFIVLKPGVRLEFRSRAKKLLWLMGGVVVFPSLFLFYFWMRGALLDFVNGVIIENLVYVGTRDWIWSHLFRVIILENSVLWVLAFFSIVYIFFKDRQSKHLLLAVWTLASVCAVFIGKSFYGHYFTHVIPGLCLLSAYAVLKYTEKPRNILLGFAIAATLLYLLFNILLSQVQFYVLSPDEISARKYCTSNFVEAREIGRILKQEVAPQDTIYVWGAEPEVYFYVRARSASRFIYYYPLVIESPGVLERRGELMRELKANPPRFIIWVDSRVLNDPLHFFIRRHYRLYFVKYGWAVFKEK